MQSYIRCGVVQWQVSAEMPPQDTTQDQVNSTEVALHLELEFPGPEWKMWPLS